MKGKIKTILEPLISIMLALILGCVIIVIIGENPIKIMEILIKGAFGSKTNISETLLKSTTLIFTGLSYSFAYRCGLINIGAEGQLFMGASLATFLAINIKGLPAFIHLPIVFAGAVIGGGLWGLLAAWLKNRFEASEIITTVMLNYIAIFCVSYLVTGPMIEPPGNYPQSAGIQLSAYLPKILSGTRLNIGFIIAILCLVAYFIYLWHSPSGYEMRVVGMNKEAAKYSGINVKVNTMKSMFIAGGFAGLAGCVEILGIQHRLIQNFSSGFGYDGIAVGLLGGNHPVGIFFSSILFGGLRSGGNAVQMFSRVPSQIIDIIQSMVILFVISSFVFKVLKDKRGGRG